MRLSNIQAYNFLSYKELNINIPKDNNLIGIIGDNGAGKSSFLESIAWGLFGKTNRNSLEKHIPNMQDPKKAKVILSFDNGLVVERQKNPPLFTYTVNGEVVRSNTISSTQKLFNAYLNSEFSQYSCSNYFDDILNSSFLTLSLDEKRKVIGQYFELEEFFQLRKLIKTYSDKCKKNLELYDELKTYNIPKLEAKIKTEIEEKKYSDFWVEALADDGIIKNNLSPLFQALTDKVNEYLKLLFGEEIFLSISPTYEIYLKISGMELGPKSVSSSQSKRLNLAVMLALSSLHRELKQPKLGSLLVFDEFSGLDFYSKEKLTKLVKELGKTNQVFFVTHDKDLLNLIDPLIFKVTMKNQLSTLVV